MPAIVAEKPRNFVLPCALMNGLVFRPIRARLAGLAVGAACLLLAAPPARSQSRELIVDILTTPSKYWNRTVVLRGHVRRVTPNPPGTNRGMYLFRDSSDQDLMVETNDLPAQGKEYTVTGRVEQVGPDTLVPVLKETRRSLGIDAPAPKPPAPPRQRRANAGLPSTPVRGCRARPVRRGR